MKIAVFSSQPHDRQFLSAANEKHQHELKFLEPGLNPETVLLARGCAAVCAFVNDDLSAAVLAALPELGVRLVALRCAGFNNVDLHSAAELGLTVVRVPAYSPHSVAEHTAALILALNRKLHRAYTRVREGNLALEGLLGFDLFGKTVGIVGTGRIGTAIARILRGFGCLLLAYDVQPNPACVDLGVVYAPLRQMWACADVVTLHCPLTPQTRHLINGDAVRQMKDGVMLINTSRGGLIDTRAVIAGLKSGKIAYLGLDVYEEEEELFFQDLSNRVIQDDVFARLLTFPNVLITGHQAFFTREALANIAETTLANVSDFAAGRPLANQITADGRFG